jgi:hypothetical protein
MSYTPAQSELHQTPIDAIPVRLRPLFGAEGGPGEAGTAMMLGMACFRPNRLLKRDLEFFGPNFLTAIAERAGLALRVSIRRRHRRGQTDGSQ